MTLDQLDVLIAADAFATEVADVALPCHAHDPELFFAASLLVVVIASLATEAAGLSPIIGALLAGLLIAETDYHREVEVITAPAPPSRVVSASASTSRVGLPLRV